MRHVVCEYGVPSVVSGHIFLSCFDIGTHISLVGALLALHAVQQHAQTVRQVDIARSDVEAAVDERFIIVISVNGLSIVVKLSMFAGGRFLLVCTCSCRRSGSCNLRWRCMAVCYVEHRGKGHSLLDEISATEQ